MGQSYHVGTSIHFTKNTIGGGRPKSIKLVMLLDAKCDPNILGIAQQSPLLYAVGLQNNAAVEDLLIARAEVNYAPVGFEPPLCVAIRHRMVEIAKTLLTCGRCYS